MFLHLVETAGLARPARAGLCCRCCTHDRSRRRLRRPHFRSWTPSARFGVPWGSSSFPGAVSSPSLRRELHGLPLHHRAGDVPSGHPRVAGQEPRAARPRHRRGRGRHPGRHHRRHGRDGHVRHHHPGGVRRHAAPRRRAPHLRDDHHPRDRPRRPQHEHARLHAAHHRLVVHHQPVRHRRAEAGSAPGRGRRQGVRRHQHHGARRRHRPLRHQDHRPVERGEAGATS